MIHDDFQLPTSRLRRYQVLFAQGEPCHGAWLLTRGKVAIGFRVGGRSMTIKYAEPGTVLGVAEAVGGGPFRTTAVAATNIEAKFIPRNDILEIIQDDPVTGLELVQMVSENVSAMYQTIRGFKFHHPILPDGSAIN